VRHQCLVLTWGWLEFHAPKFSKIFATFGGGFLSNQWNRHMPAKQHCPVCQKLLPDDSPMGLCPGCLVRVGFKTEGEPCADFTPPTVGEMAARFPQFEILGFLGRGGMGAVYKARQPSLDRLIALKILQPSRAEDPGFAERFTREARVLARLNHPNIVMVYDFGTAGDLNYLAMEYVDGANLRQTVRSSRPDPEQALRIVSQICDAPQFAHGAGVVHRDIKPENILLDKKWRVKIADFGIAKMVGAAPEKIGLTGARDVVGTPHYMAPEQVEQPDQVDHRADIFSLGVVFYELLTGELPIGKFSPPSQKVGIDVRLDEVVLRTLEKEPERRYQRVGDVKSDMQAITGSGPMPSAPGRSAVFQPGISKSTRQGRRWGWIGAGVGGGVLILAAAVVMLIIGGRAPDRGKEASPPVSTEGKPLCYAWKAGESLAYSVEVKAAGDEDVETVTGHVSYVVRSVDGDQAALSYGSRLDPVLRVPKPGRQMTIPLAAFPHGPPDFLRGPTSGMPSRELRVDAAGKVVSQSGRGQALPHSLGAIERLIFDPLPRDGSQRWGSTGACVLTQTRFVPISPVSHFVREEEITLPAVEIASYQIISNSGAMVLIHKRYEVKTDESTDGGPRVSISGEGMIRFDAAAGVPRSKEFTGTLTETGENTTRRTRLTLTCVRVENPAAITESATNPVSSQPQTPEELSESERRDLLRDLQSDNTAPRNLALGRLAGVKPSGSRDEIVQAITVASRDPSWATRLPAVRALGVWGDSNAAPLLIERLDDQEFAVRWAAMDALTRLKIADATGWIARRLGTGDSGKAEETLREFGPAAEDAVLERLKTGDPATRCAACRALKDIGTQKSIALLKTISNDSEGILRMYAKEAIQAVEARTPR
jgi:predicted Ser/Thr protein kinase